MKKVLGILSLVVIALLVWQLMPAPPLQIPAKAPVEQREALRLLNFEGIANFRDLGGYATESGEHVKWGVLYRTGMLAHSTDADLEGLKTLGLTHLIDFRSAPEKEEEPNRLPQPTPFEVTEIPTLDDGNEAMIGEIMERIESGNFEGFDPHETMIEGNRQFASEFTPQFRQFINIVLDADGSPVVWHCSAGKDRAGFAAAILLRILGVAPDLVMQDYMASKKNSLEARRSQLLMLRLFKGKEAAQKLEVLMGVEEEWLAAGFDQIDKQWGSFDNYVRQALQLSEEDIARLRHNLLSS